MNQLQALKRLIVNEPLTSGVATVVLIAGVLAKLPQLAAYHDAILYGAGGLSTLSLYLSRDPGAGAPK